MTSTRNLRAARKFGPGYFIREQMEIRGWVQEEMAEILGISIKHLNSILQDKQSLTIENAKKLASAFDTSPQYWLNLDNDYRLWLGQGQAEPMDTVKTKTLIYSRMPIRDMMKKAWIQATRDINELKDEVKRYWQIDDLNFSFLEEAVAPLYKKSEAYNQFNASYAATWFQMANKTSENFEVPAYEKEALNALFSHISGFTKRDDGIADFLQTLNASGVKFFVLPHLEKTYLDGAAFLHNGTPVIVYTARYKRIDNFWFAIAHEIAHVLRHLSAENPFILDNLLEETADAQEKEANELAATALKHPEILDYLEPNLNYLTVPKIMECSETINIHPAIIIGALAHNKSISYRNINLFNENVLEIIPENFIHESVFAKA